MQLQLMGLREGENGKRTHKFYDHYVTGAPDLFQNIDKHVNKFAKDDRWNIYFNIFEGHRGKTFVRQNIIPFDIDKIEPKRKLETAKLAVSCLKLKWEDCLVSFSGNGIQFFVILNEAWTSDEYFKEKRQFYKAITSNIQRALKGAGLKGNIDDSVWGKYQFMRIPNTANVKPHGTTQAEIICAKCRIIDDWNWPIVAGIPSVEKKDYVNRKVQKAHGDPDHDTIIKECEFIKWNFEKPGQVSENQWYAALSIVGHFKEGEQQCHKMSEKHPGYTHSETEMKYEQAITSSGPRTCTNIETLWDKCHTCRHYNKDLTSPILIKGPHYIKTLSNGFHEIVQSKDGNPSKGSPCYEDLRRYFEKSNKYVSVFQTESCHTYNGKHWEICPDAKIKSFAQDNFRPTAKNNMRSEFKGIVLSTNGVNEDWFDHTTVGKVNLSNGVLDLKSMEMLPHSTKYGFVNVLPYDYEPNAICPNFDQFMNDIMMKRQDLIDILYEYLGYALVGGDCRYQKALLLIGEGSNGKSTLINVVRALVGDFSTAITLSELKDPQHRYNLIGKLFNLSEETSTDAFMDSSIFKNLVTGGEMSVKLVYKPPFITRNKAKFIISMNELPFSRDSTKAFFRRLLMVPFDEEFTHDKGNMDENIEDKLMEELPGILNKLIEGYKRLERQRRFTHSDIIAQNVEEYRNILDLTYQWKSECMQRDGSVEFLDFATMYTSYCDYLRENGEKQVTCNTFSKKIKKHLRNPTRTRINGVLKRGYKGWKLVPLHSNF